MLKELINFYQTSVSGILSSVCQSQSSFTFKLAKVVFQFLLHCPVIDVVCGIEQHCKTLMEWSWNDGGVKHRCV